MNDTTDYAAIRRDLAMLCCRLRGLDPEHLAPGSSEPQWKRAPVMDTVNAVVVLLGNEKAAQQHLGDLSARPQID